MPSSIPYDHPSLILGNIVDPAVLIILKKINQCQTKIDAAQDKMNSFIALKRSMEMTMNELNDMNVDVSDIQDKQPEMDQSITKSASDYLSTRIENETQIQQLREQLSNLVPVDGVESPVDFSKSTLSTLPLAAESLKLDSQYFSFGGNQDSALAQIEKFVRNSTSNLGAKSEQVAGTVSSQVKQQLQNHSISGTLIIAASCTHSYVKLFEPLVLDADKSISAWNSIYSTAKIDTNQLIKEAMLPAKNTAPHPDDELALLVGAGYGSSFIGMVHLLQSSQSSLVPTDEIQKLIGDKLKWGGWLENNSGGFGVDPSVINEVKAILNSQNVSTHISLVVMGSIPSIASNQLKYGVDKLAAFDPSVLPLVTDDSSTFNTVDSDAEKAKTGAQVLNTQNAKVKSLLSSLGNLDKDTNNVLDINSMMTAFENYLTAIKNKDQSVGVPVSFNLKKITRSQIEQWWQDKYYPRKQSIALSPEKTA